MHRIHFRQTLGAGGRILLFSGLIGVFLLIASPLSLSLAIPTTLLVALSMYLMHRSTDLFNFRALGIPAFAYIVYIALIFIPSFFVYADQIEPFRSRYLTAVESVLITVPLGIIVTNALMHFKKQETAIWMRKPISVGYLGETAVIPFVAVAIALIGLSALHASEAGNVPILYLLQHPGDYFTLQTLREESFKLLDSPFTYAFALVRDAFYPFLIAVAFGRYLQSRARRWLTLFLGIFALALTYNSMTIEKMPVALLILQLYMFYFLYKAGRVGRKFIFTAPILFLAFPYFVLKQASPELGWSPYFVLQEIGERIFYSPASVLYYYFEIFPDVVPYLHGGTIGRLRLLLGQPLLDVPNLVGSYMEPGSNFNHANGAFIGNLNADFGMAGVFVGGILAGAIMALLHIYLVRARKDIISVAAYSFLAVKFAKLSFSPLPVLLLSDGIIPVVIAAIALRQVEHGLAKLTGESRARDKLTLPGSSPPRPRLGRVPGPGVTLGR